MTSNTAETKAGTVLVTGASRGLGRALADLYAAAGFRVLACMRQASGDALPLDVADAGSIAALGERLAGEPVDEPQSEHQAGRRSADAFLVIADFLVEFERDANRIRQHRTLNTGERGRVRGQCRRRRCR